MAQTNYYIGETTNSAGESEINLRLFVSRNSRLCIGSGIWIDRKRWGKKDEINIPLIQGRGAVTVILSFYLPRPKGGASQGQDKLPQANLAQRPPVALACRYQTGREAGSAFSFPAYREQGNKSA